MRLRHSLLYSFLEKYSSFIVQFAANITIARLLTPEEIGVFSVGIAVFTFAHAVRDFGVSHYLIQEQDLTNDRIRAALTVTAGVAWSLAIIIAVASPFIASFYNEPGLAEVLIVLALAVSPTARADSSELSLAAVSLNRQAVIEDRIVRLGDLFAGIAEPGLAETPIAQADLAVIGRHMAGHA